MKEEKRVSSTQTLIVRKTKNKTEKNEKHIRKKKTKKQKQKGKHI